MYKHDDGVPAGALADARLAADEAAAPVFIVEATASESTIVEPSAAPQLDAKSPGEASATSSMSLVQQVIEQSAKAAYFDRLERQKDLSERTSMLRISPYRPYDERTRNLVKSVAAHCHFGAFVQHLLDTPPPEPKITVKQKISRRTKKNKTSIFQISRMILMQSEDDKVA
ncbi:hypothetical protein FF100_32665 [Methylobacterium terricola]|uniref:Uncharacterized protein n=1 Tax=Methylobacterium terricola TaxID=2583531 RepID=A0A5C4L6E5_9HYPH|nr:hypothetical protein [Methylobacterium terricola]TNC07350.1 hypothetical protein FF100_32665 [Methylobacterium terricola]